MSRPLSNDTPLTDKEKRFVKKYVQTGRVGEASLWAGYTNTHHGSFLKAQPKIQNALMVAMEKAGVTDSNISRKIKQGMNAKYPPKRDGAKQYPDYFTRKHYIDMVLKVRGDYAPEKHEISQKQIVIVMNPETIKGLVDAKAVSEEEAEVLEAEIINDVAE